MKLGAQGVVFWFVPVALHPSRTRTYVLIGWDHVGTYVSPNQGGRAGGHGGGGSGGGRVAGS